MARFRLITAILWLFLQGIWLTRDALIRDGDEEGHVGAAELIKVQLETDGWLSIIPKMLWIDLGEYPPLYASLMGIWWKLVAVQPEDLAFQLFGGILLLFTAFLTSETAKNRGGDANFAFALMLCLPLATGLSRHMMIENLVLTCTALGVWATTLQYSNRWHGVIFGVIFGLGLLSKQSFILVGAGIFFFLPRRASLVSLPIVLLTTIGWYLPQSTEQHSYLSTSISSNVSSALGWHFLAPFAYVVWDICGPLFCGYLIWMLIRHPWSPKTKQLLMWVALSLLIFILIPKKYPRLMLSISIPLVLLLCEQYGKKKWDWRTSTLLISMGLWILIGSFFSLPSNPIQQKIDSERCPQVWLRPPFDYDLGLHTIKKSTQGLPSTTSIVLINTPTIPCSIQTTHPFPYHLEIYLRRHQIENPIHTNHTSNAFQISWNGPISNPTSLQLP